MLGLRTPFLQAGSAGEKLHHGLVTAQGPVKNPTDPQMAPASHFAPRPRPLLTAAAPENQIIPGIESALTSQVFHLPARSSGWRVRDGEQGDKPPL